MVTSQVPAANSAVPGGSTVILYLGGAAPEETGTVPNVVGQSYEAAKNALEAAGFFMRATGTSTFYTNSSRAQSQSDQLLPGPEPERGRRGDRGHRHGDRRTVLHRGGGRLRRTGLDGVPKRAGRPNAQNLERMKPHP